MAHSSQAVRIQLQVCTMQRYAPNPTCCANKGSKELLDALKQQVLNNNMDVEVVPTNCLLQCNDGPNIKLSPSNRIFSNVSIDAISNILQACRKIATI